MSAIRPNYLKDIGGLVAGGQQLTPAQIAILLTLIANANREPLTLTTAELILTNDGHLIYGAG